MKSPRPPLTIRLLITISLFLQSPGIHAQLDPEIAFTCVPALRSNDNLTGSVANVDPDSFRVAVYIHVGDLWWTKPTFASPTVTITAALTWTADITTGGSDALASEIAAYLIPSGVNPPQANGAPFLPAIPEAVAFTSVSRLPPPRRLDFSGYSWEVKRSLVTVGPGPNLFSDAEEDVWVDESGLHLTIEFRDERWYSTEVILDENLGHGTYVIQTDSRVDLYDPNVVGGLFTWDTFAPELSNRELDIEFAKWGDALNPTNAQYVVQPCSACPDCALCVRFQLDLTDLDKALTHYMNWQPGTVTFRTFRGHHLSSPPENMLLSEWTFSGAEVQGSGAENFRANLSLFRGFAPTDSAPTEMTLTLFAFEGNGPTVLARRALDPEEFASPGQVTVTVQIEDSGFEPVTAIGLEEVLPAGWTFDALIDGDLPAVSPSAGASGTLEFAWTTIPALPATFRYRVLVPSGQTGSVAFNGLLRYRKDGPELNVAVTGEFTINLDVTPPVLTLNGAQEITLECNIDTYSELGASVADAGDPDITVIIGGAIVDTSEPGLYIVTYDAVDLGGNAAVTLQRMVTVRDTMAPFLVLNGSPEVAIELGVDTYVELGAVASDICDDNVVAEVGGDAVDSLAPGVYEVQYTATDSSGNSAVPVVRTVTVMRLTHSADVDGNFDFSLSELLRVIQFFNIGSFHCDDTGEDGFNPGIGGQDCFRHDSDFAPTDWSIGLSELLRLIQFFNSDGYHVEAGTEDGLAPGPAASVTKQTGAGGLTITVSAVGTYLPGQSGTIAVQFDLSENITVTALGLRAEIPDGWTLSEVQGDSLPNVVPDAGAEGPLEFAWFSIPSFPFSINLILTVPADAAGLQSFSGEGIYRTDGDELSTGLETAEIQEGASPDPPPICGSAAGGASTKDAGDLLALALVALLLIVSSETQKNTRKFKGDLSQFQIPH